MKDCPKNEQRAEKPNFQDNCEILRTFSQEGIILQYTSKPGKGFIYFITLQIISQGQRWGKSGHPLLRG